MLDILSLTLIRIVGLVIVPILVSDIQNDKLLRKQVYQYTYSYKNHHSRPSCKKFAGRHNKIGDM
jgi:hypothetical protein